MLDIKFTKTESGCTATLPDGTTLNFAIPQFDVYLEHTYFDIPLEINGEKRTERIWWNDIKWQ